MGLLSLLVAVCVLRFLVQADNCTCHKDFIRHGSWILAFKGHADIGVSMYDTWMNDAIYHDSPVLPWLVKPECVTVTKASRTCRIHFKSRVIPMWENLDIQKVKVLLLKNNKVRATIVFDGRRSTKTSWFSQSRVISSPWRDLKTAPANYFSIRGHWSRHFFMSSAYRTCPTDLAWMFVIDTNINRAPCKWDKPTRFPKIVYTPKSYRTKTNHWLENFEYGDAMVVLVKLGR